MNFRAKVNQHFLQVRKKMNFLPKNLIKIKVSFIIRISSSSLNFRAKKSTLKLQCAKFHSISRKITKIQNSYFLAWTEIISKNWNLEFLWFYVEIEWNLMLKKSKQNFTIFCDFKNNKIRIFWKNLFKIKWILESKK